MSLSEIKGKTVPVKIWAPLEEVESKALDQLRTVAALPWVVHHVAAMPDCHWGNGATVGSVIAMRNAVSPAAIGVDIGCGMGAILTNLKASDLPDNLKPLRREIERRIPVGFKDHRDPVVKASNNLFKSFKDLHPAVQDIESRAWKQCGTLGGGNHFIEVCLDQEQRVWIMLHSGSRNIGKTLAEIHMHVAKKLTHNADLPDKELAVFLAGTPEMEAYHRDLSWAQEYAFLNRKIMFEILKKIFMEMFPQVEFDNPILCHHNYLSQEVHFGENLFITRKGAISAKHGELGIIPGSMGTKSYIVRGLGNAESFESASHGAGRCMSRGRAKTTFTIDDFLKQTEGVECRKDEGVLDEIPGAYKPIERVMENQKDLVEVVAEIKQILCVKGGK